MNALLDSIPTSQIENECNENIYEDVILKTEGCEEVVSKNECCENVSTEKTAVEAATKNVCLEENYDSLEPHIYVNIEGESLRAENLEKTEVSTDNEQNVTQDKESGETEPESEASEKPVLPLEVVKVEALDSDYSTNKPSNGHKLKKFYEKDSLPPCLRARNLKHQLKTRSLDEEEFEKEFGSKVNQRRTSFDEGVGYKTNSLPKTLNQPKSLPEADGKVESIHLAHSIDNINISGEEEEQKKRERIERYKEERRRILQDKYR